MDVRVSGFTDTWQSACCLVYGYAKNLSENPGKPRLAPKRLMVFG
jgi:hypothetical protein